MGLQGEGGARPFVDSMPDAGSKLFNSTIEEGYHAAEGINWTQGVV